MPDLLTSGMFEFLVSMDNHPISTFSAGLVPLAILASATGDRLVGLRKLTDF